VTIKNLLQEAKELITEKLAYDAYLKDLGYDSKKFKEGDPDSYKQYKGFYGMSKTAAEFEQSYLDDLERNIKKIKL